MLPSFAIQRTMLALAVAGISLVAAPAAHAQSLTVETQSNVSTASGDYAFPVKYLCGTIASATGFPLAAGTYLTAINILNFGTSSTHLGVNFSSFPLADRVVGAGQHVSLDCTLNPGFLPSNAFAEGFFFITRLSGGHKLRVVAVYTLVP